jgi:TolA-binding protein
VTREGCPGDLELTRALQAGAGAPLAAHLARCADCGRAWDGFQRAIRLARLQPFDIPPLAQREEVRTALLAAAQSTPPGAARAPAAAVVRWVGFAAAASVLAVAVTGFWAGHGRHADVRTRTHASVRARTGADYAIASGPPDETLRLRDGTIFVEVDPLGARERFRVVSGDDEIEVRGTAFEVTASANRLLSVVVTHGRVDVRPGAGSSTSLGPGQSWRRAELAPASPAPDVGVAGANVAPAPAPARSRARTARSPAPAAREGPRHGSARTAQEALYDDAWDAMRSGDFRQASARFAGVVAVSPAGPLADEGAYWRAVALARAGRSGEAVATFRRMLDGYPASPRRGEASAMLGWLLVDARELEEAARRFRAAADDPQEAVRASARRGLALLARPPR